jgi:hypothetical protein
MLAPLGVSSPPSLSPPRRRRTRSRPPLVVRDRHERVVPPGVGCPAAFAREAMPDASICAVRLAQLVGGRRTARARRDHATVHPDSRHSAAPHPDPLLTMPADVRDTPETHT